MQISEASAEHRLKHNSEKTQAVSAGGKLSTWARVPVRVAPPHTYTPGMPRPPPASETNHCAKATQATQATTPTKSTHRREQRLILTPRQWASEGLACLSVWWAVWGTEVRDMF